MAQDVALQPVRWGRMISLLVILLLVLELMCQVYVYFWTGERFRSFHKQVWSPYGLVRNNPDLTLPGFHHNRNGFARMCPARQASRSPVQPLASMSGF